MGATVPCPGTHTDRRRRPRGDRRAVPRPDACRHRWGRVGPATVVSVRVKRGAHHTAGSVGPTMILECPDCHQPIEFLTRAADRAA